MGQRLNLEITAHGEVLANAYYHWSAYTESTAELAKMVLDMRSSVNKETEPIITAIKLLEATGAGFNKDEIENIKDEVAKGKLPKELLTYKFAPCVDRNEGILGVSRKETEDIRGWAEGTCQIDLAANRVNFGVVWEIYEDDYDSKEEYKERISDAVELPYDLADMSIEEAYKFFEIVKGGAVTYKDKTGTYYSAIY